MGGSKRPGESNGSVNRVNAGVGGEELIFNVNAALVKKKYSILNI